MNKDFISGVVLLAVSGTYYTWSSEIADSTLSDEVGATGLPHMLSVILAILAVLLMARAMLTRRVRTAAAADADDEGDAGLPRAIGFLLLGAVYVFVLPFIGYVAGTALLIGAVALYEGAPRNWVVVAAAVGGAVFYWAIFVKLLGVHQPVGSFFQGMF